MSDGRSVLQRIFDAADRHPSRIALQTGDATSTYAELISRASSLAAFIARESRPGDRIGILGGDGHLTYALLLATWMAGRAYVPLHRADPEARVASIARDAGLALIFGSGSHQAAHAGATRAGVRFIVPTEDDARGRAIEPAPVDSEDLAYLLFTSGSTGAPKGVPITHGNLAAFLNAWAADPGFQLTEEDRVLQMFDISFDLSVMSFIAPLTRGASCHVVPGGGIAFLNVAEVLRNQRISFAMMVPSVLSYLHRYFDEIHLPDLRHSMFAGEALLEDLAQGWSRCVPNARIQNSYGPTETTIICTIYDWERGRSAEEAHEGIVPIGWPMRGTRALVLDPENRPVEPGVEGELCLQGPQLMRGYWNAPDRTREAFVDLAEPEGAPAPWYRTGDLVADDGRGCLSWHMRKDFQVKIDGHRIELGEIEAHARRLAETPNVVAVTTQGPDGRPALALFLEGGVGTEEALARGLADRLPDYMRPKTIRRLPALPLNSSGKIDRLALRRSLS